MQHVLNMKRTRVDALHQCFDCSEFLGRLKFFGYNRGKSVGRGGGEGKVTVIKKKKKKHHQLLWIICKLLTFERTGTSEFVPNLFCMVN